MFRLLILILCALAASAQAPPPTDAQIESQLQAKLAKSVVGKDGFTARVKAGVVYWEGSTTVAQHKGAATRMAKSSGARRVVNNIKVKKPATSPPKAAAPKPTAEAARPLAAPTVEPPLRRVTVRWRPRF